MELHRKGALQQIRQEILQKSKTVPRAVDELPRPQETSF